MCNERFGWSIGKGYYGESQMTPGFKTQPSDLELRIREEVMELSGWLLAALTHPDKYILEHGIEKAQRLQDRLNLLWDNKK